MSDVAHGLVVVVVVVVVVVEKSSLDIFKSPS